MEKQLGLGMLICLASLSAELNGEIITNGILNQLGGFRLSNSTSAELGMFSTILMDPHNGLIVRAEQALGQRLTETVHNYNVSASCLNHTETFLQGLVTRQIWAIRSKCHTPCEHANAIKIGHGIQLLYSKSWVTWACISFLILSLEHRLWVHVIIP